jgi:type VI secretion system protein ImpG
MPAPDEELLSRYLEELSYLRSMGARFARQHKDVAHALELSGNACPDPHIERLIESFAFLTARIQSDLAGDFPEIAAELLRTLYPHYLNPIPSMTIVRFDPKQKLADGALIPRDTPLFASTTEGDVCRFRTCYPVELWPVEVVDARVVDGFDFAYPERRRRAPSILRLRLRATGEPFEKLSLDSLRFFLDSEMIVNQLYPLLLEGDRRRVTAVAPYTFDIPDADYFEVAPVGFAEDEDVIHYPRLAHPAYRLLQEYFAFEQKFHFVDVKGLRGRLSGQEIDLLFLLDGEPPKAAVLHRDAFALGCAPAVNLFTKTSEPIRVNHRSIEYRLVADYRRERSIAIHSIRKVSGTSNAAATSRDYAPFYSFTHHMALEGQSAFWHARRAPAIDGERSNTDILLSFRDTAFMPTMPGDEVVFAHLLCSNGELAAQIAAGQELQSDQDLAVSKIISLRKPTRPLPPPIGGEQLWRLVSHLSLNYLSIDNSDTAIRALREILLLYCPAGALAPRQRIDGIKGLSSRKVTRRVDGSWNGFARGTEISLVFDDNLATSNGFLLASVLSHFFGLHASINSFTQLIVQRDDGGDARFHDRKGTQWPIMPGAKAVL